MLRKIRNKVLSIRIAIAHAAYHRYLKRAIQAKLTSDVIKFKQNIYKSEDAWRKVVVLTNKKQLLNGKEISI